jgi:hypothetical protein
MLRHDEVREMTKNREIAGETVEKRKVGRPSKGKRANFTFRLTDALRAKLAAAAEESDLSMSEEIERRLDVSFSGRTIVEELLGGHETSRLLLTIGHAIRVVEITTGKSWTDDYETVTAAKHAMRTILDLIREPTDDRPMSLRNLFGPNDIGVAAAVDAVKIARKARQDAGSNDKLETTKKSARGKSK